MKLEGRGGIMGMLGWECTVCIDLPFLEMEMKKTTYPAPLFILFDQCLL
jgi:hypothetical protein